MSDSVAETKALKMATSVAAAGALAYAALSRCLKVVEQQAQQPESNKKLRRAGTAKTDSDYIAQDSVLSASSESEPEATTTSEEEHRPLGRERSYRSKFACCDTTKVQHRFMDIAVKEAKDGVQSGEGGPFGACITRKGEVVARAHNMVLQSNDPTAHAEVTCIRKACARLGRFDLSDCVLYTSCEPCPMCFGATHWAKIPVCVFAANRDDAARAGFDDAFIYDAIKGTADEENVKMVHQPHQGAVDVFGAKFDQY